MKTCSKCKSDKDLKEFHKSSRTKDGLRHWCKVCTNKDNASREHRYIGERKLYRDSHKIEAKGNKKIYYINNREAILKSNKNYRTSLNYKYIAYKNNAKNRNIYWGISKEEFSELWNLSCHYCGNEIATIGVDRKDSGIGYLKNNIVPCCSFCNTIKMDLEYFAFLNQIIKIYKHLNL